MATKKTASKKTPAKPFLDLVDNNYQDNATLARNVEQLLGLDLPDGDGSFALMRIRRRLKSGESAFEDDRKTILMRHAEVKDRRLVPTNKGEPKWRGSTKDERQASQEIAGASVASLLDAPCLDTDGEPIRIWPLEWKLILDENDDPPQGKGSHLLFYLCDACFLNAPWQEKDEPEKTAKKEVD